MRKTKAIPNVPLAPARAIRDGVKALCSVCVLLCLLLPRGAQAQNSLTNGLISYWTFDDPTNLGKDSVGTNNGVVMGGAYPFTGRVGPGAVYVDGSSGYIAVPDAPELEFAATNSYTVAAWAYPAALPTGWEAIVEKSRDMAPWYGIWLNGQTWIYGTSPDNIAGTTLPTDPSGNLIPGWHHIAIMQDGVGDTTSLYVDGTIVNTASAYDANGAGALWIGGDTFSVGGGLEELFNGVIDDVRIYNRTLSDAEVAQLYNAPLPTTSLPLALLVQPQDASIFSGEQAVLTAQVNAADCTSQWYKSNSPVGAAAAAVVGNSVLNTGALSYPADNGAQFYVVFTGAGGSITSRVATVIVGATTGIDSGLVGHWTFDDPANLGKDSAGTNDAVVVGGAYPFAAARIGAGAVCLDGVSGTLRVADNPSFRFAAGQSFTLSAWAYPLAMPGGWTAIVEKGRDLPPWYGIWLDTQTWDFGQYAGGSYYNLFGPTLPTNDSGALILQWHHAAITQDGVAGTTSIYVDGSLASTGAAENFTGTGALWIGGDEFSVGGSLEELFNGVIDDVRLYNRALSAAEITQLYTAPAPTTNQPLALVVQPQDVATIAGQQATLTALANNFDLTDQWYKGTSPLGASAPAPVTGGGANASLTIGPLTAADNGTTYYVVFAGSSGAVTSRVVHVTVKAEPADGLIAHYTFDNPADLGADSSTLGLNPGTTVGGATFSANSRVGAGALAVDGLSGHILVPDVPYLEFSATNSFTVAAWAYPAALASGWEGIVTKSRPLPPWYGIWLDPQNQWIFGTTPNNMAGTSLPTDASGNLIPGWHHVAIVQDGLGGTSSIYVDGIIANTGAVQNDNGAGALWIGGADDGNGVYEYFEGLIDDVRIYNVALSDSQVSALANVPLPALISIARAPGGLTITFTGTLQAAGSLSGTWTNVTGATSPLPIPKPQGTAFYRSQQP